MTATCIVVVIADMPSIKLKKNTEIWWKVIEKDFIQWTLLLRVQAKILKRYKKKPITIPNETDNVEWQVDSH